MRIFIECPDSPKEWFIIELQGEIEATLGKKLLKNLDSLKIADIFYKDVCYYYMVIFKISIHLFDMKEQTLFNYRKS